MKAYFTMTMDPKVYHRKRSAIEDQELSVAEEVAAIDELNAEAELAYVEEKPVNRFKSSVSEAWNGFTSNPALIQAATTITVTLLILNYEKTDTITSRAFSLIKIR